MTCPENHVRSSSRFQPPTLSALCGSDGFSRFDLADTVNTRLKEALQTGSAPMGAVLFCAFRCEQAVCISDGTARARKKGCPRSLKLHCWPGAGGLQA